MEVGEFERLNNMEKSVTVRYFAVFREQRGLSEEQVPTRASNLRELYLELRAKHGFLLSDESVKAALNDAFCGLDAPVQEGDQIVFIPPVAGG